MAISAVGCYTTTLRVKGVIEKPYTYFKEVFYVLEDAQARNHVNHVSKGFP